MIVVSQIVGESYDLATGSELGKGIVLTNGVTDITIPVDDEIIYQILAMHKEALKQSGPVAAPQDDTNFVYGDCEDVPDDDYVDELTGAASI